MHRLFLICTTLVVGVGVPLQASTIAWTNWTSAVVNATAGSAAGVINAASGSVNISYTGDVESPTQVNATTTGNDYWNFPSTYTGGIVSNSPDSLNRDVISFSQGNTVTDTITFSKSVVNPILAIVSLNGASMSFSSPVTVLASGQGFFGNGTLFVNTPNTLLQSTGEGNGIVELSGTFSSLTFVHTAPEFWAGFTIGIQYVATDGAAAPEPGTSLLMGGALALLIAGAVRRNSSRAF
jgi:hypothetical protein